ncbi:hypothetical protein D3C72_2462920 [compost metagenome]
MTETLGWAALKPSAISLNMARCASLALQMVMRRLTASCAQAVPVAASPRTMPAMAADAFR